MHYQRLNSIPLVFVLLRSNMQKKWIHVFLLKNCPEIPCLFHPTLCDVKKGLTLCQCVFLIPKSLQNIIKYIIIKDEIFFINNSLINHILHCSLHLHSYTAFHECLTCVLLQMHYLVLCDQYVDTPTISVYPMVHLMCSCMHNRVGMARFWIVNLTVSILVHLHVCSLTLLCVQTERPTDAPHSLHCCTVERDPSIFNIFPSIIHRPNLSVLLVRDF